MSWPNSSTGPNSELHSSRSSRPTSSKRRPSRSPAESLKKTTMPSGSTMNAASSMPPIRLRARISSTPGEATGANYPRRIGSNRTRAMGREDGRAGPPYPKYTPCILSCGEAGMTTIGIPVNARSRRTRETLLSAARAILEEDGFEALTMGGVAERAGVTRRAVYLHFASRAELVGGLFDHVAREEGLADSLERVWEAADAAAALDEWARHLARYHTRLLAVDRAVERVRRADADAARHRERVVRAKLVNCRRLAQRLSDEAQLAAPWTVENAADMLFA